MALQLVDDDQVLEAALSLLEQPDGDTRDATQQTPSKKKRRTRGYNPNRARESQHQELLALREQVPQLQEQLQTLKQKVSIPTMKEMWRKLAMHERKSRENAEEENRRLRELVRENADVTNQNVLQVLQTRQDEVQVCPYLADPRPEPWPWPYRRMYALPMDPRDGNVFREMSESVDLVHQQVLQVYSHPNSREQEDTTEFSTAGKAHCRAFADKILPYDVDSVGDAAWQFFAHSFRRPTTRFYYHTDAHEATGLVRDDTVIEIFGEEHRFGHVLLDIKVKQIVRRYVCAGRVVIAWSAILSPERFKTETLNDVVYDEKGALVIEPEVRNSEGERAAVVHTWQTVTPDISPCEQSELVQELTRFVLNSCRPGRAVQSMERTLRAQST
ncbi:hypothetical protein V7S43_016713 [Phytophthora oleae]|uniref:M96 mating-specific protein family n=1 Tax=Phytophthora oleae TaxID=2107226 RepID=A0ABD3EYT6_9STRA